jgi:hypothetical protein
VRSFVLQLWKRKSWIRIVRFGMAKLNFFFCKLCQDCGSHSYANIGLQGVDAPNLEQSLPMDNDGPRPPYGVLTISGQFHESQSFKMA